MPGRLDHDAAWRPTSATGASGSRVERRAHRRVDDHGARRGSSRSTRASRRTITITIESDARSASSSSAQIHLDPAAAATAAAPAGGVRPHPGRRHLTQSCSPDDHRQRRRRRPARSTATNNSFDEHDVDLDTTVEPATCAIVGADGADDAGRPPRRGCTTSRWPAPQPGVPSVGPGSSWSATSRSTTSASRRSPIGDEEIINFNVPAFVFDGADLHRASASTRTATSIVGGGTAEDNNCCNLPAGPDPAPPNNMLAPFWTDLDGTGAAGHLRRRPHRRRQTTGSSSSTGSTCSAPPSLRTSRCGSGSTATQDITFAYDPAALPGRSGGQDFLVGAENELG